MILASCGSGVQRDGPAWNAARTSADGRSILLVFTGGAEFDPADPCTNQYRADVDEADSAVTIGLVAIEPPDRLPQPADTEIACAALGYPRELTVDLDEPLGERQLIDARTGITRPPFDGAGLLHPGWIPDGWIFLGEGMAFPDGDTSQTWSQGWGALSSDNIACPAFALMQGTPEAMNASDPFGFDTPIGTYDVNGSTAVHATTAQRFHERLTWTRGDVSISVIATSCEAGSVEPDSLLTFARSIE